MSSRPFIIGLTGGIGSGKSAVTERLAKQGATVFDADLIAREQVEPGMPALAEIVQHFGPQLLDARGALDRAALRAQVFASDQARARLNAIVHPRIHARLHELAHTPGPACVVLAIPLLIESITRYHWLDRILVVDVPRELQIQRSMARDRMDRTSAERMLAAQTSRQQRLAHADDVIINDGPIGNLDAIVARLWPRYLRITSTARPQ